MTSRETQPATPEDSERWRRAVQEELAAKPDNIARVHRRRAALNERTLSGQLRRGIASSGLRLTEVAQRAQVPLTALADFMAGDAPLDSDAFGRVAGVLEYELSRSTAVS